VYHRPRLIAPARALLLAALVAATNVLAAPPTDTLPDLDGKARSLAEWRGQVLAVNFWATWCGPCVEEIPELVRLQDAFGDRGLQWVGVAVEDDTDRISAFAAEMGMNYPNLIGEDAGLDLAAKLGNRVAAMPFTVIFDRNGDVVFTRKGKVRYDEVVEVIEPLLRTR